MISDQCHRCEQRAVDFIEGTLLDSGGAGLVRLCRRCTSRFDPHQSGCGICGGETGRFTAIVGRLSMSVCRECRYDLLPVGGGE